MFFVYRPATTWPGLLIILFGLPVYLLLARRQGPLQQPEVVVE
jgi:hypothetical protein